MNINIKSFYSEFTQKEQNRRITSALSAIMSEKDITFTETDTPDALLILSGGTENLVIDFLNSTAVSNTVYLLTHRSNNSLPAALEISAWLQQNDIDSRIIDLESANAAEELREIIVDKQPLYGKRIGVIGKPSDWLIASSHSADIVKRQWGADIVEISLTDFIKAVDAENRKIKNHSLNMFSDKYEEPEENDKLSAEAVYYVLKSLINSEKLDAITIRCFDLVKELKTTACYALARLNSENIPAGCEGDIPSIIGILWAKELTGKIPWMANPSVINSETGSIILAHCTAPLQYLSDIVYRSHFESSCAVGIQGNLNFQEVTILRLGGKNLDKVSCFEGKVIRHLQKPDLCRTQIEVSIPENAVNELLRSPLGNHLLVLPGKHSTLLLKN